MDVMTKKLLMQATKYYTLTVSTNPASATCTLTYDGVAHSEKTATVKEGTVIQYSVYHSTYGTTTGSITMNSNKTLSCTGTYSTTPVTTEQSWTRPNLSSNGTLGSGTFAVGSPNTAISNYPAWKAVNGTSNADNYDTWIPNLTGTSESKPAIFTFYSSTPIKISSLQLISFKQNIRVPKAGYVKCSNNNSSYTNLCSWSNSNTTSPVTINISVNSSSFYNYHQVYITSNSASGYGTSISELKITATYQTTTQQYNYYWNKTVT